MKTGKFLILFVFMFLFCNEKGTEPAPIRVTIEIKVFYQNPASQLIPIADVPVEITHTSGMVISYKQSLQGTTGEDGFVKLVTNNDVLLPKNTYLANAHYVNNISVNKEFSVPQVPNNGGEYFVSVSLIIKT